MQKLRVRKYRVGVVFHRCADEHSQRLHNQLIRVFRLQSTRIGSQLHLISPESMASVTSFGLLASTVHPRETHVPRISLTVPSSPLAHDFLASLIFFAISSTSSNLTLPLWVTFLVVFLFLWAFNFSRMRAAEVGRTFTVHYLF